MAAIAVMKQIGHLAPSFTDQAADKPTHTLAQVYCRPTSPRDGVSSCSCSWLRSRKTPRSSIKAGETQYAGALRLASWR